MALPALGLLVVPALWRAVPDAGHRRPARPARGRARGRHGGRAGAARAVAGVRGRRGDRGGAAAGARGPAVAARVRRRPEGFLPRRSCGNRSSSAARWPPPACPRPGSRCSSPSPPSWPRAAGRRCRWGWRWCPAPSPASSRRGSPGRCSPASGRRSRWSPPGPPPRSRSAWPRSARPAARRDAGAAVVLVTLAFGLGQPALMAAVGDAVPADVRGVALGIATLVFLVGGGVGLRRRRRDRRGARRRPQPAAARAAAAAGQPGAGQHHPGGRASPLTVREPRRAGPISVAGHAPDDLALLRTPGVPTVSPDGRMAVVAVERLDLEADESAPSCGRCPPTPRRRPGRRRRAPGQRSGVLARRPVAGLPGRRARRQAADPAAAHRRGEPRRLTDTRWAPGTPCGHRTPGGSPTPPASRSRAGTAPSTASGPGRGAPADHHAAVPAGRRRVVADRRRQVFVLDLPPGCGTRRAPAGRGSSRPGTATAPTSRGARTAARWRSSRPATRGADRDLVRDVHESARTARGLRRVTGPRATAPARPTPRRGTLVVTAVPDLGPDGPTSSPGRPAVPGRAPADSWAVLDPEQDHRGDETPATVVADGAVLVGVERRGAVELLRVPLDGGEPEVLVDGRFTVRGIRRRGRRRRHRGARPLGRRAGRVTPGRRRLLTGFGAELGATGRLHRIRSGRRRPRTATPCTAGSPPRLAPGRTRCC